MLSSQRTLNLEASCKTRSILARFRTCFCRRRATKPPLTHFLALPLHQHECIVARLERVLSTMGTVAGSLGPEQQGLVKRMRESPLKAHITVGVFAWDDEQLEASCRTLDEAVAMLRDLGPLVLHVGGLSRFGHRVVYLNIEMTT